MHGGNESRLAIGDMLGCVADLPECSGNELGGRGIVFNDEDVHVGRAIVYHIFIRAKSHLSMPRDGMTGDA